MNIWLVNCSGLLPKTFTSPNPKIVNIFPELCCQPPCAYLEMYSGQTGFCAILLISLVAVPLCCDAFDADADISFRLFTRNGSVSYTVLTPANQPPIAETPFDVNRPTRIFVHGFRSKQKTLNRYSDAFMKAGDYNFIAVDWTKGANVYNYYSAKGRVKHVSINGIYCLFKATECISS